MEEEWIWGRGRERGEAGRKDGRRNFSHAVIYELMIIIKNNK